MATMEDTARGFFDACVSGKGWEECQRYCHPGATFTAQADFLEDIDSVEGYTEWMKEFLGPAPDASSEIRSFAVDEERGNAIAFAVFRAILSAGGDPVPATGKRVVSDYVYWMDFDGDKIRHLTKIWNDVQYLRQLGLE